MKQEVEEVHVVEEEEEGEKMEATLRHTSDNWTLQSMISASTESIHFYEVRPEEV